MKRIIVVGVVMGVVGGVLLMGADGFADNGSVTARVGQACSFGTVTSRTKSKSIMPGQIDDNFGTTTIDVGCNNASGYVVTATATALTGTNSSISYSATTPVAGASSWTAYNGATSANIPATANAVVKSVDTLTPSSTWDITYKVGVERLQAEDNYTGTITYSLTVNN